MKRKLRLFVWDEFCPDYTCGLTFAIAPDLEEAMEQIRQKMGREPYDWGRLSIHEYENFSDYVIGGG